MKLNNQTTTLRIGDILTWHIDSNTISARRPRSGTAIEDSLCFDNGDDKFPINARDWHGFICTCLLISDVLGLTIESLSERRVRLIKH